MGALGLGTLVLSSLQATETENAYNNATTSSDIDAAHASLATWNTLFTAGAIVGGVGGTFGLGFSLLGPSKNKLIQERNTLDKNIILYQNEYTNLLETQPLYGRTR